MPGLRLADVGEAVADVTRPRRPVLDLGRQAADASAISAHQIVDGDAGAAGDVERAGDAAALAGPVVRFGDVADVDEVARLLAVAVDR